jgi:hypothetical protein
VFGFSILNAQSVKTAILTEKVQKSELAVQSEISVGFTFKNLPINVTKGMIRFYNLTRGGNSKAQYFAQTEFGAGSAAGHIVADAGDLISVTIEGSPYSISTVVSYEDVQAGFVSMYLNLVP